MVSAAKGAEQFYTIEHHASRTEGIELARERDSAAANVNIDQNTRRYKEYLLIIFN